MSGPKERVGRRPAAVAVVVAATTLGCAADESQPIEQAAPLPCRDPVALQAPACDSGVYDRSYLIPGPGESDHDADLAAKARRYDRCFHAVTAVTTGINTELTVADAASRQLVDSFVTEADGWDFDEHAGVDLLDAVTGWHKVAGAYGGVGVAADAYRYATLRDQGASCSELERAREHLLADLDGLHLATAITGVEGIIARGFIRTDVAGPGQTQETTPLFDADGNPLPAEKNNGTWREDNSGGQFPHYIWEDSCSRDQLVGWAAGYAAAWEAMRGDDSFPMELKSRLQADAAAIARSLSAVGEAGYDLEIRDADGRVTYHGYLNENSMDRVYLDGAGNGGMALMALGIVAAFAYVAEDPDLDAYLHGTLLRDRELHLLARDSMIFVDIGLQSNFSMYNMVFLGGWLAHRYLCDDDARAVVRQAVDTSLYEVAGRERQPSEQKQTLYDFVYVSAAAADTAFRPAGQALDDAAVDRGLETLHEFPEPPFWNVAVENCDEQEIDSGDCIGIDGTPIHVLGYVGRNDELVAEEPIPMRIRPPSNYYWRSNPYGVNGTGDGTTIYPGVDFRFAYWMGRY
ncbi:MAG: hypothetical protein JRI23_33845, partial [Deltaproteobacteria bacterium]|nr:hypothetical protein [Deltaproteobacteria bacterium]MBW2537276.1 hypothetical protein [Deltaproteobacteria bacterium]